MEEERRQKDKDDKKKKEKKRKREKRGRGRQVDSGPESEEDITPAQQVDIMTEEMPEVGRPHMANGCFSIDFTHALKMIPALFPFRTLWLSVHSLVKMDQWWTILKFFPEKFMCKMIQLSKAVIQ